MMVADEKNLELGDAFTDMGKNMKIPYEERKVEKKENDINDLESRLASLSR